MEFTWDEENRKSNIAKHGLDFTLAKRIINAHDVIDVVGKKRYNGESRHLAYAILDGIKMCLCYVLREGKYRIISLRRVHNKEWRKVYEYENIH